MTSFARRLGLLVAASLLLGTGAARARVVEKIAAVVGDSVILGSEVEEKASPLLTEASQIPDPSKRSARASALRHEVLERLIDDELRRLASDLTPHTSPARKPRRIVR